MSSIAPIHPEKCHPEILSIFDQLCHFRHDIHAHPELGFNTERTQGKIVETLQRWGVDEIHTDLVKGSVVALIKGNRPGKTVGLRADIDALPMQDISENPWKSTYECQAHTCGHDGHQTWVLGVAYYVSQKRDFAGNLLLIFQPAEESGKGAVELVKAGVLERFSVAEIYAAHDEPFLNAGQFGFRVGPLQAASDEFYLTITGVGTHGGRPHLGVDPIAVGCEIYQACQTIVSRKIDPLQPAVLSICSFNAGRPESMNIIPEKVLMSGTVRTFAPAVRDFIEAQMQIIAERICQAHGATLDFRYNRLISAVNNHPEQTRAGIELAKKLVGEENVASNLERMMSSEDFSEYLEKVPGAIVRIGIRDENHQVSLHNGRFDFNDRVLPLASTLLSNIVLERLSILNR